VEGVDAGVGVVDASVVEGVVVAAFVTSDVALPYSLVARICH
jgi:hypothetical protein